MNDQRKIKCNFSNVRFLGYSKKTLILQKKCGEFAMDHDQLDHARSIELLQKNPQAILHINEEYVDDEVIEDIIKMGEEYVDILPKKYITPFHLHLIAHLYPETYLQLFSPLILNDQSMQALEVVRSIIGSPLE